MRCRESKDDLTLVLVSAVGKAKFLNSNLSLEHQDFTATDTLVIVPLKHAHAHLMGTTSKFGGGTNRRGSLASKRGSVGPLVPVGGASSGEEERSTSEWLQKWSVKSGKASSKTKFYFTIRKMCLFWSTSEKGAVKGTLALDMYNVERPNPTQVDLVASANGWTLAKGVIRPQISLGFESPGIADRWVDELSKWTPRGVQQRAFGVPLAYFAVRGDPLPQVFMDCVRYLYNRAMSTKELFRQGGDQDDVKFLRGEYNMGLIPTLAKISDPHIIASLFKAWLSDLPQPLLTYALYSECMTAMKLNQQDQFLALQKSIAKIPAINQRVLWITCQLLKLVHDQAAVNGMPSSNLSPIFASKIIAPKNSANITFKTQPVFAQITDILILHGDRIFSTAVHSTPPEWSYILDPNRPPLTGQQTPVSNNSALVQSVESLTPVAAIPPPVSIPVPSAAAIPPPPIAAPIAIAPIPIATPPPPAAPPLPDSGAPAVVQTPSLPPLAVSSLPPPPNVASLPPPPSMPVSRAPLPTSVVASSPPPSPVVAPPAAIRTPRTPGRAGTSDAQVLKLQAENVQLRKENAQLKDNLARLRDELVEQKAIVAKIFN